MKYEIELTDDLKKALEQIMHKALMFDGANSIKDVNLITSVFQNLKQIENG